MAGADLTQYTLVDPHHTADEPPTLYTKLAYEPTNEKLGQLTQKTPMVLNEQNGARSGLIMQNMPWSCQLMKKMMKRWCEYQKRSKCPGR
jgi:hypothetical protein